MIAAAATAIAIAGAGVQAPVEIEVAASGDILPHSPVYNRARANGGGRGYDFRPMFRSIRPWLGRADLAICHAETPIGPGPPSSYPRFRSPPPLAGAIRWAGWDACSTASNHSLDYGTGGIRSTLRALHGKGIRTAGTHTSRKGRGRAALMRVKGVTVALLAYTEHTNGIPPPNGWAVDIAAADRVVRDARRARRRGAQVVIVNFHWGAEYDHSPTRFQRTLARKLLRSGAVTAIVGQHAHVVQPIALRRGRAIVWGEGNLLSNQSSACCPRGTEDGLIAFLTIRATAERARVERVRYLPTWVRHPDFRVVPAGYGAHASYRRTVRVVGREPRIQPLPRRPR